MSERNSGSSSFEEALDAGLKQGYVAAVRWLRSPESARDACQEAAARAWRGRARYDHTRPFYPWFYRILRNVCLDRIRRQASKDRAEVFYDLDASSDCGGEEELAQRRRELAVNRALLGLPHDFREIIELRHFQDASYSEIAEALDIPIGTVMSRLYRARAAVRQVLRNDVQFPSREGQHE